ncbi:hypothetical protein QH494_06330 [Sphingomonas sp. AR_OL41]|uniref:hypothetical protein n=1 Tax=Sphingomonas sp. AR_OL41 TaxID=3042729 RepID=UPI00247FA8E7|nr:hypothetical protein [Sphingomonas sp. AR_OL41]MDH7971796.1 hypothetical protein [Sphingomonas sp. AR_OL41]
MRRVSSSGATVDGMFKASPAPATQLDAAWHNAVQEEICKVIEDATGGDAVLDPGNNGQLLAAIGTMISTALATTNSRKRGRYVGTIAVTQVIPITFDTPFPDGTEYALVYGDLNLGGSASRDNWMQTYGKSEGGFYALVQGTVTGGSNTLDGFDWIAEAI